MALEKGLAQQVEAFIASGRPSVRHQNIDDRRAAYVASTVLAGEKESRVDVNDIELEGITFRIVSPRNASGALPVLFTIMAVVSLAGVCHPRQSTAATGLHQRMSGYCRTVPPRAGAHLSGGA